MRSRATGHCSPFIVYWVPVVAYAALIFVLSAQSHPERLFPSFLERLGDKILHVIEYGFFAVLWYRAFRHAGYGATALRALFLAIVAATVYGISDEIHQAFVPTRMGDPWDVAADLAGACIGSSLWFFTGERRAFTDPIKAHHQKQRVV